VRFASPASWIAGFTPPGPDEEASEALLQKYLGTYGPAPREQFQRWFGMTSPAEAGRWIAELGDAVCEVDVEGERGWMLAADVADAAAAAPDGVVRLLPAFDHYTVAAPRGSDAVLPAAHRARVYRPQGWLSPVLLVDGRMAGTWSHTTEGGVVAVTIAPFARLDDGVRAAAEAEAERLARYLGGELRLGWEPATGSFRSRR
jgi:hypothetical protein